MKVCSFESFGNKEFKDVRFILKIKNTFLEDAENGLFRLYGNAIEGFLKEVKEIEGGVILKYKKEGKLKVPLCFLFKTDEEIKEINTIFDGEILFNNNSFTFEAISYGLFGIKKLTTVQDNICIKKENDLELYSFLKEEETQKYLYLHYKKIVVI
jgi:hypothetical protein